MLVDAKPAAVPYYTRFDISLKAPAEGAVAAPEALRTLFLPMATIRRALKG